ncbi:hypothetical protein B0H14DRAFT_2568761 [Mycena olivaceomarginata]|nr:hypothetical protein B0H14DRAFT_2568761 [Mycena olivaceomarginata]
MPNISKLTSDDAIFGNLAQGHPSTGKLLAYSSYRIEADWGGIKTDLGDFSFDFSPVDISPDSINGAFGFSSLEAQLNTSDFELNLEINITSPNIWQSPVRVPRRTKEPRNVLAELELLAEVGDREMRDENLADAVKAVFDASFATETAYSVFQSKNMLSSGPVSTLPKVCFLGLVRICHKNTDRRAVEDGFLRSWNFLRE